MKKPVEKVLKDFRNGFASIYEDYEVVIDPVTFKANEEETRKRREKFY